MADISTFIKTCTTYDPESAFRVSELYTAYKVWSEKTNQTPVDPYKFMNYIYTLDYITYQQVGRSNYAKKTVYFYGLSIVG